MIQIFSILIPRASIQDLLFNNFFCGLVQNVNVYLDLRFICGFTLAGELEAAATLGLSKLVPKIEDGLQQC